MSVIARIRKELLGQTQVELAALTGVTQATVSRWEHGLLFPDLPKLTLIREAAKAAKPEQWEDGLLFEKPVPTVSDVPPAGQSEVSA